MSLIKLLKKKNKKLLFTTPSHAQQLYLYSPLKEVYKRDISETDAHNPTEALINAEKKVSKIYGTSDTVFLTNGSTSGIIASVLACTHYGDKVLLWQDAHLCHHNAVRLAGAIPIYYETEFDADFGVSLPISAETLESYFKLYDDIKCLIITSPTYEGLVSDVYKIKELCKKYNVYLIVDEAHGALYPFSDKLPQSAVKIADFTVQSLHKTAGGLNPTALLHTTKNFDIRKSLSLINTTSPSYPLLASIEENIRFLSSFRGKIKLNNLIKELVKLRTECTNCEFFGDDITKLLIKVPKYSGYELSKILFERFNIEDEITNEKSTMLLCGIGTSKKKIQKLKHALQSL